jgi:anti-sigma regulatory factor (Ser/Thr protein kinase)
MEAFVATLVIDPSLLRGLRHALSGWLDGAGADSRERDSLVLATHEVAAKAMTAGGATDRTIDVSASRDGSDSFVVLVRDDGAWEPIDGDPESPYSRLAGLVSHVSTQSSTTVRMRLDRD